MNHQPKAGHCTSGLPVGEIRHQTASRQSSPHHSTIPLFQPSNTHVSRFTFHAPHAPRFPLNSPGPWLFSPLHSSIFHLPSSISQDANEGSCKSGLYAVPVVLRSIATVVSKRMSLASVRTVPLGSRLIAWLGVALLMCLLDGCASLEPYDGIKRSPKTQIDIYEVGKAPGKPYKIIMSFSAAGGLGDEASKRQTFVEQAKKLGADAIIFKPNAPLWWSVGPFSADLKTSFSADAVVYQ